MNNTLEIVEEEKETSRKSPIVHLYCAECDEERGGECYGFCGIHIRGGSIIRMPAPPVQCVMCLEVRASIEPGMCPRGHNLWGLLV
jgi:hypothetical protein